LPSCEPTRVTRVVFPRSRTGGSRCSTKPWAQTGVVSAKRANTIRKYVVNRRRCSMLAFSQVGRYTELKFILPDDCSICTSKLAAERDSRSEFGVPPIGRRCRKTSVKVPGMPMQSDPATTQVCIACRLRLQLCVCADAPRLGVSTRLIAIIHAKEWRRSSNTGYLARLATKDGEVRLHGLAHQTVSSDGIDCASPSTLVLFPGRGAHPLTAELIASLPRPLTLLVPDGNWNQAKKMMRRVPMLSQAHPVKLEAATVDHNSLRHNVASHRMSTFEAIAQALGIIEKQATEDHLLHFFRQVLGRMVPKQRRSARFNVTAPHAGPSAPVVRDGELVGDGDSCGQEVAAMPRQVFRGE
jgi:DTW domain-containing protein YfiP